MSCLHSFKTNTKLQSHEKVCKNNDICVIIPPSQEDNILQFNQYVKSDKTPCIIYADHESLIKKIDGSANSLEKVLTTKTGEHIPCGYSISAIWAFHNIQNKHRIYFGKDCMKL